MQASGQHSRCLGRRDHGPGTHDQQATGRDKPVSQTKVSTLTMHASLPRLRGRHRIGHRPPRPLRTPCHRDRLPVSTNGLLRSGPTPVSRLLFAISGGRPPIVDPQLPRADREPPTGKPRNPRPPAATTGVERKARGLIVRTRSPCHCTPRPLDGQSPGKTDLASQATRPPSVAGDSPPARFPTGFVG